MVNAAGLNPDWTNSPDAGSNPVLRTKLEFLRARLATLTTIPYEFYVELDAAVEIAIAATPMADVIPMGPSADSDA